jgi:ABC-type proline/glycine betaine transport system substrate-binding protein
MKTLTCDKCDYSASAPKFGEWLNAMKPHYATAHPDVMRMEGMKSPEDQKAAMQQWMDENQARFEAA